MSAVQVEMEQNNNEDQQKACGTEGGAACNFTASILTSNNTSSKPSAVTAAIATPNSETSKDTNAQDEKVILADKFKNQGNDYLKG